MNFFSTNLNLLPRSVLFASSKRFYTFNPQVLLDNKTIKNEQNTTTIVIRQDFFETNRDFSMKVGIDAENELKEIRKHKKERPISPHLTIYRMPWTAIASITHRTTGIILAIGFTAITFTFAVSPVPALYWIAWLQQYPIMFNLIKYGATFSLISHTISGIRHMVWDRGMGVETVQNVEFNCKLHIAVAAVLTALTYFISL